jgi:threonine dehydratase
MDHPHRREEDPERNEWPPLSLESIVCAREMLRKIVHANPLQFSRTFSDIAACSVYLKPECLQKAGSQKIRGAYYRMSRLTKEQRERGICTFSSGNWAQGVAYAGSLLGIGVTVVMAENANPKKIAATRDYGGEVILFGHNSDELMEKAKELSRLRNLVFINPFDDTAMIVGFGTLGLEMMEEKPDLEAIVVPVGGGASIAGIALAVKKEKPRVRVYGVEPKGADAMFRSLENGRVIERDRVETIADGLAVKKPSELTFRIIQNTVNDVVLVSDDEIKEAIFLLLERAKLLVEPAGAVSLAAVIFKRIQRLLGCKVGVVLTGGNIDFRLLEGILSSHL